MKKLVLTGLSTEHSFLPSGGTPAGEAKFFLIFNDGEFRVQVSEAAAEMCVQKMMEDEHGEVHYEESETVARPKPPEPTQGVVMSPVGSTYSDDDGVDQV